MRISGGALAPLQVAGSDEPVTLDGFIRFVQSQDRPAPEITPAPAAGPMLGSAWVAWFIELIKGLIGNIPVSEPK